MAPSAIADDGNHIWVANESNSVTELRASTGRLVKVISGAKYGFVGPAAIASDGAYVWVANLQGNSITELSARTGGLVRVISSGAYGLQSPMSIAEFSAR